MNMKNLLMIAIAIIGLVIVFSSAFIVNEKEQVIITQFGQPIGEAITTPGVHFKVPLIQEANYFPKQFLEWNGDPNELINKEKTLIFVDTYARWRIIDPLLFFQKLQDERRAQSRLDDILDGETRTAIAKNDLDELVRSTNRQFQFIDKTDSSTYAIDSIRIGRSRIIDGIIKVANNKTNELGIEILDLRIKRLKYADPKVLQRVYNRMISERKKISDRLISEGEGAAQKIIGDKERELRRIRSEGVKQSEIIRGQADATATVIYANAYDRNADTREFYKFLKTLETYRKTMGEKDILMLSTESDIYKYLQNQRGN